MQLDVVFLDVGNTLIYPDPPVGEVYAQALRRRGIRADGAAVHEAFLAAWQRRGESLAEHALEYGRSADEAMDWWRAVVRETIRDFGMPDDFEAAFRELWDHFSEGGAWRLYEDVLPTVRALRDAGLRLGIISNWDVRLHRVLRDLDLARLFDWHIVSCDVGYEKPSAQIFERALGACGVTPARTLHVGDSYVEDALGARRAGMQGAWLNRHGRPMDLGDGVIELTSLAQVPELLG